MHYYGVSMQMRHQRGNIVVFLVLALSALMAVGGFALETTIYLLRRQKLQILAESVAMNSVMNFPMKTHATNNYQTWYDALDLQAGDLYGPARNGTTFNATFNDNSGSVDATTPLLLTSLNIRITEAYSPSVLPVAGIGALSLTIRGEADAQLVPTDIILIVENTASMYEANSIAANADLATEYNDASPLFGYQPATIYSNQCFSNRWAHFKRGVVRLYDLLSQNSTTRVGVILSTSRSGAPFILADLDADSGGSASGLAQVVLTGSELEYDDDQPDNHTTRCIAMTDSDGGYPVPPNPNVADEWTTARGDLSSLAASDDRGAYNIANDTDILVREALWILPAGYTSRAGAFDPRSYYHNPALSLDLAARMLRGSRRADGLPVRRRYVIVLTDDAGIMPSAIFTEEGVDPDTQAYVSTDNWCDHWNTVTTTVTDTNAKLFLFYYFGNQTHIGHDYDSANADGAYVESMRTDCYDPDSAIGGKAFYELSSVTGASNSDFITVAAPTIALATRQAELRR